MRKIRSKAFTLVEVLGSIVILGVAIVGIILCNADGLTASKNMERRVKSILLAESEMERIKGSLAQDFDQIYNNNYVDLGGYDLSKNSVENISGRSELKLVTVSIGYDTNSNSSLTSDEIMLTFVTQVAEQE